MSNYATLKSAIQSAVYTNGAGDITGAALQSVLLQIVNTVGGGYTFAGVANGGTSPGTPDQNVFYIAPAGTYTNFGSSYTIPVGSIGVFAYNGTWTKSVIPFTSEAIEEFASVEQIGDSAKELSLSLANDGQCLQVGGGRTIIASSDKLYLVNVGGFKTVRIIAKFTTSDTNRALYALASGGLSYTTVGTPNTTNFISGSSAVSEVGKMYYYDFTLDTNGAAYLYITIPQGCDAHVYYDADTYDVVRGGMSQGFINTSGTYVQTSLQSPNPWCASDFIMVDRYTKGMTLYNLSSYIRAGLVPIAFYNASKAFLGYYQPAEDTGNLQYEVIANVLVSDAIASKPAFSSAKYFCFTRRENAFSPVQSQADMLAAVVTSTTGFITGTGTIYAGGTAYKSSCMIPINDATKALTLRGLFSMSSANAYPIAFYAKNGSFIGTWKPADDDGTTNAMVCSVRIGDILGSYANAWYFRFCYLDSVGFGYDFDLVERTMQEVNWRDKRWILNAVRNVICIGDSVTQGFVADYPTYGVVSEASYPTRLGYLANGWEVTNAGRSGDSPTDWYSGRADGTRPALYPNYNFADYELGVLFFGYNGALYAADIDTEGTNTNNYLKILQGMRSQNPNIKLVLMRPSWGTADNNWGAVVDLLASRFANCSVIPLHYNKYISLDTDKWHGDGDSQGTIDMVHFTELGYNALAYVIYNSLIDIFADDYQIE